MIEWWRGTRLVLTRALVESLRSTSFKIVTGLLLVGSIAFVVVPEMVGDRTTTYTLATVGHADQALVQALDAAGRGADFDVDYTPRADQQDVVQAVRDGDATVGLAGKEMYVAGRNSGTFPTVVAQVVVQLQTAQRITEAHLTPQQLAALRSVRPPHLTTVGAARDGGRMAVGFAVGIVLYLALLFAGNGIATAVAVEKASRISEVLLSVLRPSQTLVGTVLSAGCVTMLELLALGAPLAVGVRVSDEIALPSVAAVDLMLAAVWFVLGFAVYSLLYAASGALVDKVTEVNNAVLPVTGLLLAGYLASILVVFDAPESGWSVLASMFPLTAPIAMPLRWASGDVPVWQLLVAMVLTAGTAAAVAALASAVYSRALLLTGRRLHVRDVLGRRAHS